MSLKEVGGHLVKGEVKEAIHDLNLPKPIEKTIERTIGLTGVVIISLSAMLGSGIFVLPAFAAELVGPNMWLAYLLAATIVLTGAISKSELSSAMPQSGGTYIYLERTFGAFVGTISGMGLYASFMLKSAFALIGFAAYLHVVTDVLNMNVDGTMLAMTILVGVVIINILGAKKVKAIQTPVVTVALIALLGLVAAVWLTGKADASVPIESFTFNMSTGQATALVFVAYAGVTKIAAVAGEVKNPEKNLPGGMLISLAAATILYVIVTFTLGATMPEGWQQGGHHGTIEDPMRAFAEHAFGSTAGIIISIIAIVTMASMSIAGVLAASRFLFAMSRDNLLPSMFENINARFETPHWPILFTGLFMGIAILTVDVHAISELASGFKIMIFMVINATVFILRNAGPRHSWYQPAYKSPLYPIIQIYGIFGGAFLLFVIGQKALIGAGAALVIGSIVYFTYGRSHVTSRVTPFDSFRKNFLNPTPEDHQRYYQVFHAADLVGSNHLNLREFKAAIRALGITCTSDECRSWFHQADTSGDGYVDIDEFLAFVESNEDE